MIITELALNLGPQITSAHELVFLYGHTLFLVFGTVSIGGLLQFFRKNGVSDNKLPDEILSYADDVVRDGGRLAFFTHRDIRLRPDGRTCAKSVKGQEVVVKGKAKVRPEESERIRRICPHVHVGDAHVPAQRGGIFRNWRQ